MEPRPNQGHHRSHSDEKCLEKAAEYLGSQGMWVGGPRMWKVGDKIEVTYRRERSKDGIQARAFRPKII